MRTKTVAGAIVLLVLAGCSGNTDQTGTADASPSTAPSGQAVGKPNGVETMSAEEVLKQARKAARKARSVHVVATSQRATLDMEMTRNASDGERSSGDKSIQTRVVGNTLYLKADPAYWKEAFPNSNVARIGDRWVAANLSSPKLRAWRQTTKLDPLMNTFLSSKGAESVGAVGEQQGQPAVPVTSVVGTVWVATTGRPYVLAIESATGDETSNAEFTDWNAEVKIDAPPPSQTIDIVDLR